MIAHAIAPSPELATPETYLDPERAQGENLAQPLRPGVHFYPGVNTPVLNEFGLHGTWRANSQAVTPVSAGAFITGRFQAAHVYLVLTSAQDVPRQVRVLIDGRPIPAAETGADVHGGAVTVTGQRLYSLVSLPSDEQHTLTVDIPPGVSAYDFTFG